MRWDVSKINHLHQEPRLYPELIKALVTMKSVWQARRKVVFAKDRKDSSRGCTQPDMIPSIICEESSEKEEAKQKHKTALRSQTTISLLPSLEMKPKYQAIIEASSPHPKLSTLTDMKPPQSSDSFLSPPMPPPTCDVDPFDSDDESLSSEDSIISFSTTTLLKPHQLHPKNRLTPAH